MRFFIRINVETMNKAEKINKNTVLLIATIASFLTPFMASSVNVALPVISQELGANAISLSWVTTAFLLTSAMLAIPFGRVADIYGMKKIFITGIIIFTISAILASISPSVEFLIFSRIIQGVGSSMIFVTGLAIITSVFPSNERGKAIGMNVSAIFIGLMIGPVLGGILTEYIGWRSIFYLTIFLGILTTLMVLTRLKGKEWASSNGEKFDLIGSVIYALSLLLILVGFSKITNLLGQLMLTSGIICSILFVIWELKVIHPVLEIRLFLNNKNFAFSNLAVFLSFTSTSAVIFLLSLYLQYIKGLDPKGAGLILVTQTIFMVLISPVSGRLSDKYDSRILSSIGMGIAAGGLIILAFLNVETHIYWIIISLILIGIGSGLFATPNTHSLMSSVPKKYFGVASASSSTMRIVGQTLSMGLVLLVFSLNVGTVQFNPTNYPQLIQSINVVFTISAIFGLVNIFFPLIRNSEDKY